jgi:head-tail adaptor
VLRGDLVLSRNPTRVRLRYRTDIDGSMRIIVHGDTDRTLQIIGGPAEYGGRKQGIEFLCEEISS